jgi:hypothetical protein
MAEAYNPDYRLLTDYTNLEDLEQLSEQLARAGFDPEEPTPWGLGRDVNGEVGNLSRKELNRMFTQIISAMQKIKIGHQG